VAWQDLFSAIALVFVIEGIMPFISPGSLRKTYQRLMEMNDLSIRITGLLSMIAGVVILGFIR